MIITRENEPKAMTIDKIPNGDIFFCFEDNTFYLKTDEKTNDHRVICYDLLAGKKTLFSEIVDICIPITEIKIIY